VAALFLAFGSELDSAWWFIRSSLLLHEKEQDLSTIKGRICSKWCRKQDRPVPATRATAISAQQEQKRRLKRKMVFIAKKISYEELGEKISLPASFALTFSMLTIDVSTLLRMALLQVIELVNDELRILICSYYGIQSGQVRYKMDWRATLALGACVASIGI